MATIDYAPGLAGVPAAESSVSFVDGEQGILEYRNIPIQELAAKSNYEETSALLLDGESERGGRQREKGAAAPQNQIAREGSQIDDHGAGRDFCGRTTRSAMTD